MEEARRFLRYVVPGLVFIIEIMATLLLMDYPAFVELLSKLKEVGAVLGIFIASGGLGYLFSNSYHWVYWSWPHQKRFAIDHKALIESLGDKIQIRDSLGDILPVSALDKRQCWVIINVYWHTHLKSSKRIEGVNKKNDQISDITHGLGGTVIATLAAALTCLFLKLSTAVQLESANICWLAGLWFFFIVPTLVQYYRSHKVFQAMVNSTFANEIIKTNIKKNKPVALVFSK